MFMCVCIYLCLFVCINYCMYVCMYVCKASAGQASNMRNLTVYLDTTYCDATYTFPAQHVVVRRTYYMQYNGFDNWLL